MAQGRVAAARVLINGKTGRAPNLVTKRRDYQDVEVHVEFMVAKGSNSGVILHGNHEIQILDSAHVKKPTGAHCGGVYPRAEAEPTYHHIDAGSPPRVNAAKPPGQWQTLDILFRAARLDEAGTKTAHARFVRVVHNGKVIQENVEVPYACGPNWDRKQHPQGPIIIQGDYRDFVLRFDYRMLLKAGVNAELHVFSKGSHGFGMGNGRGKSVATWPNSLVAWLADINSIQDQSRSTKGEQ